MENHKGKLEGKLVDVKELFENLLKNGIEKDKIILKGRIGDNRFYNNHISRSWAGFLDQSNTHKEYLYASMQNKSNILDIQKIYIKIRLKKPMGRWL